MDNYYSRWFFFNPHDSSRMSKLIRHFAGILLLCQCNLLGNASFLPEKWKAFHGLFLVCWGKKMVLVCICTILMSVQFTLFTFSICWIWLQGPLAWALIVWRCSLVFNSADKLVSVLIHLFPGELILPFPFYHIRMLLEKECYLCIWNSIYTEKGQKTSLPHFALCPRRYLILAALA